MGTTVRPTDTVKTLHKLNSRLHAEQPLMLPEETQPFIYQNLRS